MHFTHKAGLALALLTAGSLALGKPAAAQHVYDASADFSTTSNPSPLDGGVFSYGREPMLGGAFTLDLYQKTITGNLSGQLQGWGGGDSGFPMVLKNTSSQAFVSSQYGSTITIAPSQLDILPGANGEYSVLRFTAPTTSTFSFTGDFNGADSHPTTTDVHVLENNVSIADGGINVNGGGNTASLTGSSFALTQGDTLDFVVGYGNGSFNYDSTGLYAKVTDLKGGAPVPEASTTVSFGLLLILGLGALAVSARRRKAQSTE